MVDTLIEDYEKSGIVDERRELLIKNAAGQIYGGTSPYISEYTPTHSFLDQAGVETVSFPPKSCNTIDPDIRKY